MNIQELRALDVDKLTAQLNEKLAEHADSRRSLAAGELANTAVIREQRREIARLKSVIAEQRQNDSKEKDNA